MAIPKELVGTWRRDPADPEAGDHFEDVTIDFDSDGSVTYTIHTDLTDQKIFLSCRVKRGLIISTQPSAPREEVTEYVIDNAGRLILSHQSFAAACTGATWEEAALRLGRLGKWEFEDYRA